MKPKANSVKKMNTIDKFLAKMTKDKRDKMKITNSRNERGDSTMSYKY